MSLTSNLQGTSVAIYAIITPGPALSLPYPWDCMVDEKLIPPEVVQERVTPTIMKLCSQDGLSPEASHNITLLRLFTENQAEIYIDYIEYLPLPANSSRSYPYLGISYDDPSVEYSQEDPLLSAPDGTLGSDLGFNNTSVSCIFSGKQIEVLCGCSERKLKSL